MIRVVVQDENGNAVSDGIDFSHGILPEADDLRFHCIRFVDPYGDTLFNRLQFPALLDDLRLLAGSLTDAQQLKVLSEIEQLVLRWQNEPHVYVRMIGD